MNLAELLYLHLIIQTCLVFFNRNDMNFMQVKELRPPLASMSPFYTSTCNWSGRVFLYCYSCASRLEKGLLKASGGLNSLFCIKLVIFLLKNT